MTKFDDTMCVAETAALLTFESSSVPSASGFTPPSSPYRPRGQLAGRQVAEPAVHVEPVARVPGDLRIDLVEIRLVFRHGEVVVRVAGQLRQRQVAQNVLRDLVDPARRNEVARVEPRIGRRGEAAVGKCERHTALSRWLLPVAGS